jgi:hypothetical protein
MAKHDRITEAMWLEYQTVLQERAHGWYAYKLLTLLQCFYWGITYLTYCVSLIVFCSIWRLEKQWYLHFSMNTWLQVRIS